MKEIVEKRRPATDIFLVFIEGYMTPLKSNLSAAIA